MSSISPPNLYFDCVELLAPYSSQRTGKVLTKVVQPLEMINLARAINWIPRRKIFTVRRMNIMRRIFQGEATKIHIVEGQFGENEVCLPAFSGL